MVRFEVVDLFLEHHCPQVLAQEFNNVQLVRKPWSVS